MIRRTLALVVAAAVTLPALAAGPAKPDKPAPPAGPVVLFPKPGELPQPDQLIFSHHKHYENGVACTDCHDNAQDATVAGTVHKPKMDFCYQCHDEAQAKKKCGMCHVNAKDPSAVPPPEPIQLHFNHKAHLAMKGVTCLTCHTNGQTATHVTERLLPKMNVCRTCHVHQQQMDRLACDSCHKNLRELTYTSTGTAVHGPGFFGMHGAWAKGSSTLCATCHDPTFCADCHSRTTPVRASVSMPDRTDRHFIHRGDWLGRHALEADAHPATCQTCHGTTFCKDCHDKTRGVAKDLNLPTSPHPTGWIQNHGLQARMHIEQCAACHDQGAASICVNCHKPGGPGGDPHPAGFTGRESQMHTSSTCVACHTAR